MSTARRALNQDLKEENKQGISSILGLSGDGHSEKRLKTEFPLRRTLSADMSSKRFLAQNDHHHQSGSIKKVASSEEISISSGAPESDEDDDNRPSQFDIWNSIQSKKSALQSDNSPPYVHPLMRRSSSSLSSKSLEMCTESLGSETGSDLSSVKSHPWFSFSAPPLFFPSSEEEDQEEEDEEEDGHRSFLPHDVLGRKVPKPELHKSVNYNCRLSRRSPSRFFPPPLPSINRRDGPCLHVKPHRQDGRLVLEAVAVPSHNYLHAERRGGRLLLSFISTTEQKEVPPHYPLHEQEAEAAAEKAEEAEMNEGEIADHEEEEDCIEEEEGEEAEQEEVQEVVRIEEKWRGNGPAVLELHRSIEKLISQPFINMNPWQQKKAVVDPAAGDKKQALVGAARVPQGLNAYECCWKGGEPGEGKVVGKVRAAAVVPSFVMNPTLVKAATGLAPSWRCNEPRRTHHIWILQHYCIATT
ncbi:FAF-like protein [Nymphaea thermarum]|nr:FAF-like protein [Nymphaea thermarum]